jgi:hypothetical protein
MKRGTEGQAVGNLFGFGFGLGDTQQQETRHGRLIPRPLRKRMIHLPRTMRGWYGWQFFGVDTRTKMEP